MEISSYSISLASGYYGLSFKSEKKQRSQIKAAKDFARAEGIAICLLYTSPSPRD